LGPCCGGAVTLLTEVYTEPPEGDIIARSTDGRPMPLAVRRLLDRARGSGQSPAPQLLQGWMVEPVARPQRQLWVWGAGHVGRAIVGVVGPLPALAITWVDVAIDRFPALAPPDTVRILPVSDPGAAVALCPTGAEHLILTYSHALDLDLCHRLLTHGFARAGLIGSVTKWARFRARLSALGHSAPSIARIQCPIGDPALGKHPQAIAIGVARQFLSQDHSLSFAQKDAG
jgi:xanthine dehydrogenase accessory factor